MKSLCASATSLILIFVWQVSCLPVNSSCQNGLSSPIYKKILLLIDVSASMESQGKLEEVVSVLKEWINQEHCSTHLGIVQFASRAVTLNNLTEINDESRSELVKNIPTLAQGDTCIPCGLKEAIKVLSNSDNTTDRPIIVLITDAVDSELDLDEDGLMELMKASHAKVVVAVLSNDVLNHTLNDIEKLTNMTSGFSHYIQDENLPKELMDMLIEMANPAVNNAPTTLPEMTEEIVTSIPISNETFISTVPTTETSNASSTIKTNDTPLVSTASSTSVPNFSISTNTSVTTTEADGTTVTSVTSPSAPVEEKNSLLMCFGIAAVVGAIIAIIIIVAHRCYRKRNKRPCASHGSYAPTSLRPIHGDQVLVKYAAKPNDSFS